jgi:hypothetical protein
VYRSRAIGWSGTPQAPESCWRRCCQVMLATALSRRLDCNTLYMLSHASEGAGEKSWLSSMSVPRHASNGVAESMPWREVGLMLAVAQNRCQAVHGAAESMLGVEQYRYRGDIHHDVADHHANMTSCPGAHMHGSKIEKASHDECH